jgi:hypothetical protein
MLWRNVDADAKNICAVEADVFGTDQRNANVYRVGSLFAGTVANTVETPVAFIVAADIHVPAWLWERGI